MLRVEAETRVRHGWARARQSVWPVVEAALAGAAAFWLARHLLGHTYPFFAPVAAWVALGFSRDRTPRHVAELSIGVAIGVGAGDLVVHLIGSGWWQMALVLVLSALLARFLDRSAMLTTQAGVQAIVVVGLPTLSGGPFGRWLDAALGGAAALAVTLLTPTDPRRRPRALARTAAEDVAGVLHAVAAGLATGSATRIEGALVRGRASQPVLDEALEAAQAAVEVTRVSPGRRRSREELAELVDSAVQLDRAMRNARVVARRASGLTEAGRAPADVTDRIEALARATDELADALGAGRPPTRAVADLRAAAAGLDPHALAAAGWQVQALVLLLRPLAVDLLHAAGVAEADARAALPDL